MIDIGLKIGSVLVGLWLVGITLSSAVRNFVLPRSSSEVIARLWFTTMRRIFNIWAHPAKSYEQRDRVMAFYAPIALVMMPGFWLILIMLGYTLIFWGAGVEPFDHAMKLSVSSLLTLGFVIVDGLLLDLIVFTEAAIGLVLIALLISYLPTIYSAFSRREALVTMLEVRAGTPPTAVEMLSRYQRLKRLELLGDMWIQWEQWFSELEETHTSLAVLSFFRSPRPQRSWITAAGAILDTASLAVSSIDIPHDVQADICIRSGYIALRHIADFFRIPYDPDPHHHDDISITREEFDEVYAQLKQAGLPMKPDTEQCWHDFRGWRVNYDTVLLTLAALMMAPYAPWSADRSPVYAQRWVREQRGLSLFGQRKLQLNSEPEHDH